MKVSFVILFFMALFIFCKADIDSSDIENLIMAGMQIETSIIALNKTIELTKIDSIKFLNNTITHFQPIINNFNNSLTFIQNQQKFINHIDETITFTQTEYEKIKPIIYNINDTISFFKNEYKIMKPIVLKKINIIEDKISLKFILLASISFFGSGALIVMIIITCFVVIIKKINHRQENTYIPMQSV